MKDIYKMNKAELIQYFKELQPCIRWNFESLDEKNLIECILMHFSHN